MRAQALDDGHADNEEHHQAVVLLQFSDEGPGFHGPEARAAFSGQIMCTSSTPNGAISVRVVSGLSIRGECGWRTTHQLKMPKPWARILSGAFASATSEEAPDPPLLILSMSQEGNSKVSLPTKRCRQAE